MTDLTRVSELLSQGRSERYIADHLQISRWTAGKLVAEAKRQQERQEQRGDVIVVDREPVTPDEYAEKILSCWRSSVEGILDTGRWLTKAKLGLGHGYFLRMVEERLPFSEDTAQSLMRIAGHPWLTNTEHVRHLPASWGTLAQLSRLDPPQLDDAVRKGVIKPDMIRADVSLIHSSKPLNGEILPPNKITNPASPSPDGEAHQALQTADPVPRTAVAIGAPPLQGAEVSHQGSEREVMPSAAQSARPCQNGLADATETGVAPPRPDQSDQGGAEEFKPSPKGWNASRTTPRESRDFFPTGPWITRTLFERVLPAVGIHANDWHNRTVWEPACGEGHMAEVISEYTAAVSASDIHDYGYDGTMVADFLNLPPGDWLNDNPDWIITNPPYNGRALEFALRALDLATDGVALFVSVQWIAEGKERYDRLFRDRAPTLIAFFVERAPVHEGKWEPDGDTQKAYCWAVWRKDRRARAPIWIPPGCRESLTRPDDEERFTKHPVVRKTPDLDTSIPGFLQRTEQAK